MMLGCRCWILLEAVVEPVAVLPGGCLLVAASRLLLLRPQLAAARGQQGSAEGWVPGCCCCRWSWGDPAAALES